MDAISLLEPLLGQYSPTEAARGKLPQLRDDTSALIDARRRMISAVVRYHEAVAQVVTELEALGK